MRVLAIDSSLRNTGVAIVESHGNKLRALHFGIIHNATSLRSSSCLVAIHDRITELIHKHEPDCCALESVIYVQSYKTAIILGAARGAAILAAAERGLPVFEYAPRRVKQATVGRGEAQKNQIAFMVRALFGLTETPTPMRRMHSRSGSPICARRKLRALESLEPHKYEPMTRYPLAGANGIFERAESAGRTGRPKTC